MVVSLVTGSVSAYGLKRNLQTCQALSYQCNHTAGLSTGKCEMLLLPARATKGFALYSSVACYSWATSLLLEENKHHGKTLFWGGTGVKTLGRFTVEAHESRCSHAWDKRHKKVDLVKQLWFNTFSLRLGEIFWILVSKSRKCSSHDHRRGMKTKWHSPVRKWFGIAK